MSVFSLMRYITSVFSLMRCTNEVYNVRILNDVLVNDVCVEFCKLVCKNVQNVHTIEDILVEMCKCIMSLTWFIYIYSNVMK